MKNRSMSVIASAATGESVSILDANSAGNLEGVGNRLRLRISKWITFTAIDSRPLAVAALLLLGAIARGEVPAALQDIRFDQRLNEQIPLELTFNDESGRAVKLGDYFGRRPVILVLAYYQCPRLCTLVLNGLVQGMLEMPLIAGKDFEVITVSFDPRERPDLAASKKESYVQRYGRPGAAEGWHFLTGEESQIHQLADAVGFHYRFDPGKNQYMHASGIMIATPEGRLSRYFYDVKYSGRDLRLGLVEASQNKIGSAVEQILLYCFHYDPTLGRYSASVMNFIRVGGIFTVV
jgi:protein SCO1/2